jgi:HK97 family phage major capsid protein
MADIQQIRKQLDAARARRKEILDEVDGLANRDDLSPGQQTRLDQLLVGGNRARGEVDALEHEWRAAVRAGIQDGSVQKYPGDQSDYKGPEFMKKVDPWEPVGFYDGAEEIRDRGLAAIDRVESERMEPEDRERVDTAIRAEKNPVPYLAQYVSAASSPTYWRAFNKLVRNGRLDLDDEERAATDRVNAAAYATPGFLDDEQRASLSLSGASAIVPIRIDPTILLSSAGARGDFRSFSRHETITQAVWYGATSAGSSAEWTSELSESTDATPTISAASCTPVRGDVYISVSYEVMMDTNVGDQVGMLMADAKYVLEQAAFATGAGGATAPEGVVTALSGVTSSRLSLTSAGAGLQLVDVYSMVSSFTASRFVDNSSWAAHWATSVQIRQLAAASTQNAASYWTDGLQPGTPPQLLGRAFHEVSGMNAGITTGSQYGLVLGDFSRGYLVVDRIGMTVTHSDWIVGTNSRPVGAHGFFGVFRTGAKTIIPGAFKILK